MTHPIQFLVLALFLALPPATLAADEPKHLLVAKFTLQRLEKVNLTPEQKTAFNSLSAQLRKDVDALRAKVGIDKEVMGRRDEAHRALKGLKLEDAEYWKRLQADASLSDDQLAAFKTTQEKFQVFKREANALLTDEQKALLKKK